MVEEVKRETGSDADVVHVSRFRGHAMNICDFSKSFLRFTSNRIHNTARLQLDALCALTDKATGRSTRYALTAPCIAENMYQPKDLIQAPTCEFRMIASEDEYRMIKNYPTHELDADMARRKDDTHTTFDGSRAQLTELAIFVNETEAVCEVRSFEQFQNAFLGNQSFVGVTELQNPDGSLSARMEYPVRTSNILQPKHLWQVDAGPVLYPDFTRRVKLSVEWFARAYIVFNDFSWAEIVIHQPAPVTQAGQQVAVASNYHDPFRLTVPSRLYALA
jgi:hypothetical protein